MPEIIDGVTYATTPAGRPYPSSASPGKAFWQLIERAMRELDDFETNELAAMTTQIQGLANLIASSAPGRRMFTKTDQQSVASPGARLTWVADSAAGDPGTGTGSGGITLASDGLVTAATAGLYALSVVVNMRMLYPSLQLRNCTPSTPAVLSSARMTDSGNSVNALRVPTTLHALVALPAGGKVDAFVSTGTASNTPFEAAGDGNRPVFTVVRLGA